MSPAHTKPNNQKDSNQCTENTVSSTQSRLNTTQRTLSPAHTEDSNYCTANVVSSTQRRLITTQRTLSPAHKEDYNHNTENTVSSTEANHSRENIVFSTQKRRITTERCLQHTNKTNHSTVVSSTQTKRITTQSCLQHTYKNETQHKGHGIQHTQQTVTTAQRTSTGHLNSTHSDGATVSQALHPASLKHQIFEAEVVVLWSDLDSLVVHFVIGIGGPVVPALALKGRIACSIMLMIMKY